MKPLLRLAFVVCVALVAFSSCKKASPKNTKYIPKDASFVATLNTQSVKNKLVENQLTIENLLKSMSKNDTALDKGKKEWEDIKNSGIDLDENIYMSVVQEGGGQMSMEPEQQGTVTSVVGGLEDAAKFEAYIKKKDPTVAVTKENEFSFAGKEDNLVAWGKDVVVFMSISHTPPPSVSDSTAKAFNAQPVKVAEPEEIKAKMLTYLNLKDDEAIGSIPQFRELVAENADGSLWINSSAAVQEMPIPLPKVQQLLENSYSAATVNFEDGKVVLNSKTYSSKAMADILEKYSGSSVNLDLVKNYPSNNIDAFFVASFNPDFFNGVIKFLEVGGFVDGYIQKTLGTNYTAQDVLKSIKGDMAIVVSDVGAAWVDSAAMGVNHSPMKTNFSSFGKVLMNVPVGDATQFNRLMDKLVEQKMLVKTNNEYKLSAPMQSAGFAVSVDAKNFLVGSDSAILMQYKSGTAKANVDAALLESFKGKSSVGFVDLEKIMSNPAMPDTSKSEAVALARATFKNIKGYTENFNGKFIEGRIELNMKNEKENSLTSILKLMEAASKDAEKHKGDPRIKVITDTVPAVKKKA